MTYESELVKEVREARKSYARQFHDNPKEILQDLLKLQEQMKKEGYHVVASTEQRDKDATEKTGTRD